jgi:hypothetical protein
MKIPVTFLPDIKLYRIDCTFRAPRYHSIPLTKVKFVIDTGSSISFVGQVDAVNRLRVPINSLEKITGKHPRGLTGSAMKLYKMSGVLLYFLDTSNQAYKIECSNFSVAVSESAKESTFVDVNLLGNDFLIDHKLKFIANPHGESYLESVEEEKK